MLSLLSSAFFRPWTFDALKYWKLSKDFEGCRAAPVAAFSTFERLEARDALSLGGFFSASLWNHTPSYALFMVWEVGFVKAGCHYCKLVY